MLRAERRVASRSGARLQRPGPNRRYRWFVDPGWGMERSTDVKRSC